MEESFEREKLREKEKRRGNAEKLREKRKEEVTRKNKEKERKKKKSTTNPPPFVQALNCRGVKHVRSDYSSADWSAQLESGVKMVDLLNWSLFFFFFFFFFFKNSASEHLPKTPKTPWSVNPATSSFHIFFFLHIFGDLSKLSTL